MFFRRSIGCLIRDGLRDGEADEKVKYGVEGSCMSVVVMQMSLIVGYSSHITGNNIDTTIGDASDVHKSRQ